MEAPKFNPNEWVAKPVKQIKPAPVSKFKSPVGIDREIEVIVTRIESFRLDLTADYNSWLTIGFSIAAALGESGRDYFHRVSCFHSDYNYQACDLQYTKCLKRNKSGISIKSFFFAAQQAGIDIVVKQ